MAGVVNYGCFAGTAQLPSLPLAIMSSWCSCPCWCWCSAPGASAAGHDGLASDDQDVGDHGQLVLMLVSSTWCLLWSAIL